MSETIVLIRSAHPYSLKCKFVCVCVCVCVCQRERRKIELTVWGKRVPTPVDGSQTCTSAIRAHRASDFTTRVRPPRVSWNKHFRHSPVSSTTKQSCMKHSSSYLRDRDVKHLQGLPLSRTKRIRERWKIELTVWGKKSAHSPRRDSNLYLWDTRPPCFRLHHEGRARLASVETNTLDTHPSVCVCVCVCVCARERRKIELTVWGKKVPIAHDGIRTRTSGIHAHRASDYTTKVGPTSRQSKRTP